MRTVSEEAGVAAAETGGAVQRSVAWRSGGLGLACVMGLSLACAGVCLGVFGCFGEAGVAVLLCMRAWRR